MSTYKSFDAVINEIEHWLRLSTLLHSGLKESLLAILHNDQNDPSYTGLPRDPTKLYNELNTTHQATLVILKNRKLISKDQWDILFPNSGTTDSSNFDTTLTVILLTNTCGLQPPATGWDHRRLPANDNSKAANVIRAREWRNFVHHTNPTLIDVIIFKKKWAEGVAIINTLGYNFDANKLLNSSLDPNTSQQQKLILKVLDDFCKNEVLDHDKNIKEMQNTVKSVQSDVGVLNVQVQANSSLIAKQDKEVKSVQSDVGDLNIQVKAHCSLFSEHDIRLKDLECRANANTEKEYSGKKIDGNSSKRMMEVISFFPNGCILKIKVQPGYQIQSVKIRCITANHETDWLVVTQNNNEVNSVYYEVKDLNDETILLKIGILRDRKEYELELQTNQRQYIGQMTIPESVFCTHVTNVGDVFIVLTPLLGQNNEPLNCQQGLDGYIVKDDDKITTFISDGTKKVEMTVKEFDAFCEAYLNRNFPKIESVLAFPLIQMISDPNVKKVAEMFNKLLVNRYKFRAVITNLNSKKYIQCCTATDKIVHEDLPYHNRLQVFDQTTASVLNIRVIKPDHLNEDVHKEIERSIIDLNYFVSSHRHHSCSCYVIGVLAIPNLCRTDIKSRLAYYYPKESGKYTNLFYLSKEDLQDLDGLQNWWDNIYEKELKRFDDDRISHFNVDSFKSVCAQSMATIALTEISLILPTVSNNTYHQITSLLLNADQIEAIESPSNRKIIIGNYGSGKSIVLEEIAKRRFYENLHTKVKVLILYVIWEEFSLLEIQKKMLLDILKSNEPDCSSHLTLTCGNMGQIWNDLKKKGEVKFLGFLKYFLEESGYQRVHVLIDEFPTDVVNIDEIKDVNKILERYPESSVTIAPQSIMIDRRTSTKEVEVNHNRNCLDQMEMDRFELVKVMRNSIQINAVVNASQEKLKDTETSLSVYDPSLTKITMVTKFKKKAISGVSRLKIVFNGVSHTIDSRRASNEKTIQKDHSSQIGENPSTVSLPQVSVTMPTLKLEHIANFVDSEPTKESMSIIKSTYSFHAIKNGNGIEDQQPTLLKLPLEVDFKSEMSAKILKELLEEVCLKILAQTIILCSSLEEIKQVSYCLSQIPNFEFVTYIPQLQGIFPTYEEKFDIFTKFYNGSCLLTDSTGVKGVEAKRVIIFASQYEHFKMHSFMETITRGNVWSYILLHLSGKNEKRRTLGNVINELEDMELFEVRPVEMFEDNTKFDSSLKIINGMYKVNQAFLKQQKLNQSFNDYELTFNIKYPVKKNEEEQRRFLFTMANVENEKEKVEKVENDKDKNSICYNLKYKGENWSFDNVYYLLENEDYEAFRDILKYNGNMLNYLRDGNNWTFLMWATYLGSHSIVKYLTKQFADEIDVWAVGDAGHNAYYLAAWFDRVDVMKVLVSFDRSRLNVGVNDGRTPLHRAARNNNKRIVELLLDAGAEVDVVDIEGFTPDRQYLVNDDTRMIIENHRTKKSFMTST